MSIKKDTPQGRIIWTPSKERLQNSQMMDFITRASQRFGLDPNWHSIYDWSISSTSEFWQFLADHLSIKWQKRSLSPLKIPENQMRGVNWFEGSQLNYTANLLTDSSDEIAVASFFENGVEIKWSKRDLHQKVAMIRSSLKKMGVKKGDRVCGVLVNGPHAIACMLATASLGAIWASSSPDFGFSGIFDRFDQIDPKVIFFSRRYTYNNKPFDCLDVAESIANKIECLEKVILVDHYPETSGQVSRGKIVDFDSFLGNKAAELDIEFTPCSFSDPLYILFSSGTTGRPKCIVHSVGGTLLQHKKELALHTDLKAGDSLLYFTTCGWMMWNWMVSALSLDCKIVTYDGSVAYPNMNKLWEIVAKERVKVFGTSPKFISASIKSEIKPSKKYIFSDLKTILSTGSPLVEDHYHWIYEQFPDIQLSSISGGTDIISCFMLGNPVLPVRVGEIQSPGLGMAIESWASYQSPQISQKGELVCTKPFVSMPTHFWKDRNDTKYKSAYFEFYSPIDTETQEVWRHGDYIEMTKTGGVIVHGRSDATLNPGGVRIGTSEIYRVVESDNRVIDSVVVGLPKGDDVKIVLFIKPKAGLTTKDLETLENDMRGSIRRELTPRHVPAHIHCVEDVPYTRSGKKVELAVLAVLTGESVDRFSALANPESLNEYLKLRAGLT